MALSKEICEACGAEIRDGSQFCYNCGGPVTEEAVRMSQASVQVSDAWLKEDLVAAGGLETTKLDRTKIDEAEQAIDRPTEPVGEPVSSEPELQPESKLKSASNMRRKPKSFQRKAVEIEWEEHDGGPNKLFPLVALLITLAVVGIYFLAEYMK